MTTTLAEEFLNTHLSYYNALGVTIDTPRTPLFLTRVVDLTQKVTGTSQGLRHIVSYLDDRRLIVKIPYAPSDSKLVEHIKEILAEPQVNCGDYVGERLITGGSTNSKRVTT